MNIFKISIFFKISKLKNHRILNLKIAEFQIGTKRSIPQPAKAPPRVLSELYYVKSVFVKAAERKQFPLVWLLFFFKQK
jgi:hypothetical protein